MTDKVAVIFVSTVFEEVKEGPAIFARYLYKAFNTDPGMDFHVVASECSTDRVNCHAAGVGKSSYDTYSRVQDCALELAGFMANNPVIHSNLPHAMWKINNYKGKVVVQVNDYDQAQLYSDAFSYFSRGLFLLFLKKMWRRIQERKALKKADLVLCNSNFTKNILLKSYRFNSEKFKVLYKAVDTSAFYRSRDPKTALAESEERKWRLIFVGTDWLRKGLDVLLESMESLVERWPGITLEVVGPAQQDIDAALLQAHRQLIDRGAIKFCGPVSRDNLPAFYWKSDLCVLPSRREALGVAILESLAAGVPVVATNVGGIPEIICDDSSGGVLVESGSSGALTNAINDLLNDRLKLSVMSQQAVETAERFSVEKMVKEVVLHYKSLTVEGSTLALERNAD